MSKPSSAAHLDGRQETMLQRHGLGPRPASDVKIARREDIPLNSMFKPLTYQEADAKVREGADSFSFQAGNAKLGRVDVVSLGTKFPCEDAWSVNVVKGSDGHATLYAGVFDGHNGPETSELLSRALIPYVVDARAKSSGEDDIEEAVQNAFVDLDERILDIAKKELAVGHPAGAAKLHAAIGPAHAGSCALLLIYDSNTAKLRIAATGDSRAVRSQWNSENSAQNPIVDVLNEEHNACNKQEFSRIAAAHPGEENDIMNAETGDMMYIAITRAFGNYAWKWPTKLIRQARSSCNGSRPFPNTKTPPYMTALPDVTTRWITAHDFVILGSDGLWEAISSEHAVECVLRWVAAKRAGKPEVVVDSDDSRYDVDEQNGSLSRTARPEDFAIDDLDNAAVCLLKNVLGGRHRYMIPGSLTATPPLSRYVRDDITVQVVFFQDP